MAGHYWRMEVNNYHTNEIINSGAYRASIKAAGQTLQSACHGIASESGWWNDLKTGEDQRTANNVPEKLCLIHSEISEAMEGHRKGLMDDKIRHRPMIEVELADAVIRIFDLAGAKGYDVAGAIAEKMAFNAQRADHRPENRMKAGGKAY